MSILLPGEVPVKDVQVHFVDTFDEVGEFRRWLSESRGRNVLGVDTETTGLDPHALDARIRLFQVGDVNTAWVINAEKWAGAAVDFLNTYTDTPIAFHNGCSFDYPYITVQWPDVRFPWCRVHDTMLYARIHDNLAPSGLKEISRKLFGPIAVAGQDALKTSMDVNGWTWKTVPMSSPAYTLYSGGDVIFTARLWERQRDIHSGPLRHIAEMEMQVARICADMTLRGIEIDYDYCVYQHDKLLEYADDVVEYLRRQLGVNIGSTQQLTRYFQSQGVELVDRTPKGAFKMDRAVLEQLSLHGFEVAASILDARKARKLSTTYFANMIHSHESSTDGKIHAQINTMEAKTTRQSIERPSLQNVPAKNSLIRSAFLAGKKHKLISCDFGQIELRLTAHLSGDPALVAAFHDCDATGEDFFTRVGKELYGPGFEKSDKRRILIKSTIYASSYGAGLGTISKSAKVPTSVMQPVADSLFSRFPGIKGIQNMTIREARLNGEVHGRPFVTNQTGRRLYVDPDKLYIAANYKVQSLASDELKKAMIRLDNAGLSAFMTLPIHDEVLFTVPEEIAEEVMYTAAAIMTITPEMGYALPIPVEASGPWDRWEAK